MNIVIHRGTKEIGGSCVEISSGKSRLVLDVGSPLTLDSKLVHPESAEHPEPAAIAPASAPTQKNIEASPLAALGDQTGICGLLLSHAHTDHYGLLPHLHPSIPVYAGEGTRALVDLTGIFTGRTVGQRDWRPIEAGKTFQCGNFTITPHLMDHSAFDSYAFVIEAEGKRIIYTGDFRNHGRKAKAFDRFLTSVAPGADALLMEGTTLGREDEKICTEDGLEREAVKILKKQPGIALVWQSGQNIDRLVTFYRTALHTGRLFVIDVYVANVLAALAELPRPNGLPRVSKEFGNIRVYYPHGTTKRLIDSGHETMAYRYRPYKIKPLEIRAQQDKIMMLVRPSVLGYLAKIAPLDRGTFFYSMWQGYLGNQSSNRLLDFAKQNGMDFRHLHASGHASPQILRQLVDALKPQRLIPIHTLHPDKYAAFSSNLCQLNDGQSLTI